MKRLIYCSTIIILAILPNQIGAINYRDKAITLISFSVNINSETKRFLEKFENQFPSTSKDNADKIISKIKDLAWGSFVDTIQKNVGMVILPVNTLDSSVGYDVYGFPDVNIGKAQKKGTSKFYMKIELQIGPESIMSTSSPSKYTVKLKDGEIQPMITITLTTYSNNGIIPIGKYVGSAISHKAWAVDDSSVLDGLVNDNISSDNASLMNLINLAMLNLSKDVH